MPRRLHGRATATAHLLAALDDTCRGTAAVVAVPGPSGVGKTELVESLRGEVLARNGLFLVGKFNQYQRDVPFSALRAALGELADQLAAGEPAEVERLRADLGLLVGDLGQLLVDLVPALGPLFGPLPSVAEIAPAEARHRFGALLRRFLKVVCNPAQPVVLFLDDWQWADDASIDLLARLEIGSSLRYLQLVAAWRDDEVDADHPLQAALTELDRLGVPLVTIAVPPLAPAEVAALLAEALAPAVDAGPALAAIVHARTGGNPYFVHSLIELLVEEGQLAFDPAARRWRWRLDGAQLPVGLVELFARRLARLPPEVRALLALAASLGHRFEVEALAVAAGQPVAACVEALDALAARGALLRPDGPGRYAFSHDRVQQAAFGLIDLAERPRLHLEIGTRLLARGAQGGGGRDAFELVEHLNAAAPLITDPAERVRLIALNLDAAAAAWAATAYRAALRFHRTAAALVTAADLDAALWREHNDLAARLALGHAEAEFLEGDPAEGRRRIAAAVAHARDPLAAAEALSVVIVHDTLHARYGDAIAAGRRALAGLGITLPDDDLEAARDAEIAAIRAAIAVRPVAAWFDLPLMTDPTVRMAARLLITLGPPCYRAHQRLWAVIVSMVVHLTYRYGHIPQVGYSHPAFAGLLGWVDNDYATAREFGDLAARLLTETFRAPGEQSAFRLLMGSSYRHWFEPLGRGSDDYAEAYECGLRSGNLQYVAYAFGHDLYCRFYQGAPLAELRAEAARSLGFARSRANQWAIDLVEGAVRVIDALVGDAPALPGLARDEAAYLAALDGHGNIQVTCVYQILTAQAWLVAGDLPRARAASDAAVPLLYTVGTQGLLPWAAHVFVRAMILVAQAPSAPDAAWRGEADQLAAQLAIWETHGPYTFTPLRALVEAELALVDGRWLAAAAGYDAAIDAAVAAGCAPWEALAAERASAAWRPRDGALAHAYWQQAYQAYDRWGAVAKTRAMEHRLADAVARQATPAMAARQIRQLRVAAAALAGGRRRDSLEARTSELVEATARLRGEVATRRGIEEELRQRREALERVVEARTAELRSKSERYELVLRATSDAIHVLDERGGLVEWNEAFRRHLGYADAELASMAIGDWDVTMSADELRERIASTLVVAGRFETQHRRKDGTLRDVEIVVAPVTIDDHRRLVASARDISDRRRAEIELRALHDQARRDGAAKAALLSEVNHRVKNNLTAIIGLVLGERAGAGAGREALDRLILRIRGLLEAHELLAATRWAPVRIDELASRVIRGALAASPRPPALDVAADGTLISPRQASSLALVFNELATNSLKHAPGATRLAVRVRGDGDAVEVEYRDDGPGYAAPDAAAGLGLTLVRQLVAETLRGTVAVASDAGAVTRFRIKLEAADRT